MSKRCELQKEYYQANGNYKGNGKYNDQYVRWLEDQIIALRMHNVVGQSEQLVCPDCENGRDEYDPEWECPKCRDKDYAN